MSNDKALVALQPGGMKEFDPECELHKPVLIIKAVDPGCTLELQIECCATGRVVRLTTMDNEQVDRATFERAVLEEFRRAWPGVNSGC